MIKIKKILIGTNNAGKYREICALLPKDIQKYSPNEFNIKEPKESSKEENIIELQRKLVDLAKRHNAIMEQVGSLALDLQVFCKNNKFSL